MRVFSAHNASWQLPRGTLVVETLTSLPSTTLRLHHLALAWLLPATLAQAQCQLSVTALPVTMVNSKPLVTVQINGSSWPMLWDTGSNVSLLTTDLAERLNLVTQRVSESLFPMGAGGEVTVRGTRVEHFALQHITYRNRFFWVGGHEAPKSWAGILGQDLLRGVDIDYDLPNGVIKIVKAQGDCTQDILADWPDDSPVQMLPFAGTVQDFGRMAFISVQVNGVSMQALLDTGAPYSTLSLDAARRAGISPTSGDVQRSGSALGADGRVLQNWVVPIKSFVVGGESIQNTRMVMSDLRTSNNGFDLLLGVDFFLSHRVLIAHSEGKVYLNYKGGRVFLTPTH